VLAALRTAGQEAAIELTRAELVGWARSFVDELAAQAEAHVRAEVRSLVVSSRVHCVPGLAARLCSLGPAVVVLPASAAATGGLAAREALRASGGPRTLVTRLPRLLPKAESPKNPPVLVPPPRQTSASGNLVPATHILVDGVAHTITAEPLTLGAVAPSGARGLGLGGAEAGLSAVHCRLFLEEDLATVEDLSRTGTFVNDLRVRQRARLMAGDRLRLGHPGLELQLIRLGGG
jgi:hypothetical protein